MEKLKLFCHLCREYTTPAWGLSGDYWMKKCKRCRQRFCNKRLEKSKCGYPSVKRLISLKEKCKDKEIKETINKMILTIKYKPGSLKHKMYQWKIEHEKNKILNIQNWVDECIKNTILNNQKELELNLEDRNANQTIIVDKKVITAYLKKENIKHTWIDNGHCHVDLSF